MKMAKLTEPGPSKKARWVNPTEVADVAPDITSTPGAQTEITFSSGVKIRVAESPEEVVRKLEEAAALGES